MIISSLFERCPKTGNIRGIKKSAWPKWAPLFAGLAACIWYLFRVIPKPSLASYPCLHAATPLRTGFLAYGAALGGCAFLFARAKSFLRAKWHPWLGLFFVVFVFIGSVVRMSFPACGTPKAIFPVCL